MWGIGVTSFIDVITYPIDCNDLNADSLPEPGPETSTLKDFKPYSFALLPTSSAATWAAKGVDFLDPLKPLSPADDHARAFPLSSLIVIIVLLNDETIWATPLATFLFVFVFDFAFVFFLSTII